MSVKFPQLDYPRGRLPRGGSDIWDTPQVSVVLADDMFVTSIVGTLLATEVGSDTAQASGTVQALGIYGTLTVTETGGDGVAIVGQVPVKGDLSRAETGVDMAAALGKVVIKGQIAAIEVDTDSISVTGGVILQGAVLITEVGSDTFSAHVSGTATGNLAVTESETDMAVISGLVLISGECPFVESADSCGISGTVHIYGDLSAAEVGHDQFGGVSLSPASIGILSTAAIRLADLTQNHTRTATLSANIRKIAMLRQKVTYYG